MATAKTKPKRKRGALDALDMLAGVRGTDAGAGVRQIPIDKIEPDPDQPRRDFDSARPPKAVREALEELAASIREHGVLQPILVRAHPKKRGQYMIVAGERRWRASRLAGLRTVPCVISEPEADRKLVVQLVENIQREGLADIDIARAIRRALEETGIAKKDLAAALGKSPSWVTRYLNYLAAPEEARARMGASAYEHFTTLPRESQERLLKTIDGRISQRHIAAERGRLREAEARRKRGTEGAAPPPVPEAKPVAPPPEPGGPDTPEADLSDVFGGADRDTYVPPATLKGQAAEEAAVEAGREAVRDDSAREFESHPQWSGPEIESPGGLAEVIRIELTVAEARVILDALGKPAPLDEAELGVAILEAVRERMG